MELLEIINSALVLAGANPLTSLAVDNKAKRVCMQHYPIVRDASLRVHTWKFALQRATLVTPDLVAPIFGYSYRFAMPEVPMKCLRVLEVEDDIPWGIEGRFITCDSNSIKIKFIARIEDTNAWDDLFTQYYITRLAAVVALNLTQNITLHNQLNTDAKDLIKTAKFVNATESNLEKNSVQDTTTWLDARSGGSYLRGDT